MNKKELTLLPEFRTLLRVNAALSEAHAIKKVQQRLIGIGLEQTCGRCGGCGQYSYCQAYGTTCFQCSGSGKVSQKLTPALLKEAAVAVGADKLEVYFARCARISEARKIRAKLFDFERLDLRLRYVDNSPDRSDAWTNFAIQSEITHGRLLSECKTALHKLEMNKTAAANNEADDVLARFNVVVRSFRTIREAAAAHPDFCAARVHNPQFWVEFFPKSYVVAEFSVIGHPMTGYSVKRTDYVAGAKSAEDLLLCLCNQHAACCRRCEIVAVL